MVAAVQLPENHLLLQKMGADILKNIMEFDYYWRMYRNLGNRSLHSLKEYDDTDPHPALKKILNFQKNIPSSWLKIGLVSKMFMMVCYLRNRLG
jgi:hypothetical protein